MKKKSIIQVLKTINSICISYATCNLCVFKNSCPYSAMEMTNTDKIDLVARVIKNTMDKEAQDNDKERNY